MALAINARARLRHVSGLTLRLPGSIWPSAVREAGSLRKGMLRAKNATKSNSSKSAMDAMPSTPMAAEPLQRHSLCKQRGAVSGRFRRTGTPLRASLDGLSA
ncbi:hypothetical protein D3C71_1880980 [compost metagenome]